MGLPQRTTASGTGRLPPTLAQQGAWTSWCPVRSEGLKLLAKERHAQASIHLEEPLATVQVVSQRQATEHERGRVGGPGKAGRDGGPWTLCRETRQGRLLGGGATFLEPSKTLAAAALPGSQPASPLSTQAQTQIRDFSSPPGAFQVLLAWPGTLTLTPLQGSRMDEGSWASFPAQALKEACAVPGARWPVDSAGTHSPVLSLLCPQVGMGLCLPEHPCGEGGVCPLPSLPVSLCKSLGAQFSPCSRGRAANRP